MPNCYWQVNKRIVQESVDRVVWSVERLTTGWAVRGSNPGGGEIFRTCPDRLWGPRSLPYNGYRVFPGGKERPGRDADPSPPSSAVVIKELYLYFPYGSCTRLGQILCNFEFFLYSYCSCVICVTCRDLSILRYIE